MLASVIHYVCIMYMIDSLAYSDYLALSHHSPDLKYNFREGDLPYTDDNRRWISQKPIAPEDFHWHEPQFLQTSDINRHFFFRVMDQYKINWDLVLTWQPTPIRCHNISPLCWSWFHCSRRFSSSEVWRNT